MGRFRPGLVPTLTTAAVAVLCVRLGFWQLARYEERSAIAAHREAQHALPPVEKLEPPWDALDFRRVTLRGRYTAGEIATGGIPFSRNGYAAIGVFAIDEGPTVLVNRGWIPASHWEAHREPPAGSQLLEGILRPWSSSDTAVTPLPDGRWPLERETFLGVFSRGSAIPWASIARQHRITVPLVVVLGPELEDLEKRKTHTLPAGGYTTYLKVLHHLEYAVQWFSFAAIAIGLWGLYGWRRGASSS